MPTELPIACSLSASDLSQRLATMGEIGRDGLTAAELSGAHARLRFRAEPGVRERLDEIVAAEAECCAFLALSLTSGEGAVTLDIDGPPGSEPVVAELVQAFDPAAV